MKTHAHKIGAIFYILWGLLHLVGGAALLATLSSEGGAGFLAAVGSALPHESLPLIPAGVATGIFASHAWNILWIGVVVIVTGALLNWRNSLIGYWINFTAVGAMDLGLLFSALLPGYMLPSDGGIGITLWLVALTFSTVGILRGKRAVTESAMPTGRASSATA